MSRFKEYLNESVDFSKMNSDELIEYLKDFVSKSTLDKVLKSLRTEIPNVRKGALEVELWPFVENNMDNQEIVNMFKEHMSGKELRKLAKL